MKRKLNYKQMKTIKVLFVGLIGLIAFSCSNLDTDQKLYGKVTDPSGNPAGYAKVIVLKDNVEIASTLSDAKGQFCFEESIIPDEYVVIAISEGADLAAAQRIQIDASSKVEVDFALHSPDNCDPTTKAADPPDRYCWKCDSSTGICCVYYP